MKKLKLKKEIKYIIIFYIIIALFAFIITWNAPKDLPKGSLEIIGD